MAYLFNGTSQYMIGGSAPVTAEPLTLACWYKPTATPTTNVVVTVGSASGTGRYQLVVRSGDCQSSRISDTGVQVAAVSATGTNSSGTWVHVCATFDTSGNNINAWRNGAAGTAATNPGTTLTPNRVTIGARLASGSPGAYANGDIADVGIWNAVLTADEIASLAKGFPCRMIKPENLAFYAPLVRNITDYMEALAITNTNTATPSEHARIIYA